MKIPALSPLIVLLSMTLQSADAQTLYTIQSPNAEEYGQFGVSVSGAGDVNDDTYDDVVVGASNEDMPQALHAGRAYIFSGETGAVISPFLLTPFPEYQGHFGGAVAGLGDVNNDGFDDVIIGAPSENGGDLDAGRAYVFAGGSYQLLHTLQSETPIYLGFFGASVAGAGDVNNDGFDDIVVGAHREDGGMSIAGKAYVFNGSTGAVLYSLVSAHQVNGGLFGCSVAGAGDVNSDGYDDLVVGETGADPDDIVNSGRAYIINGQTGATIHTLESGDPQDNGRFGYSVAGVGDVNFDDRSDVVVGACFEDVGDIVDAGKAYLFDGYTGELLKTLVSPAPTTDGYFGHSVSSAGHQGVDERADVLVGAYNEGSGHAYVFSGSGSVIFAMSSPGGETGGGFGISVSKVRPLAEDPYPDLVFGANYENGGATDAGKAYVQTPVVAESGISGGAVVVEWSSCPEADGYWVYGASNEPLFDPGTGPGYEYRLDQLPSSTQSWSSTNGVADPMENWSYLILAVDPTEDEIARSNRIGEFDFQADLRGE